MGRLILAKLSEDQIVKAKQANGPTKKITHMVICEGYGQMFGTEKQCSKYFNIWKKIFKRLFPTSTKADSLIYDGDFLTTFDLVNILCRADTKPLSNELQMIMKEMEDDKLKKKVSLLEKLFG